MGMVRRWGGQRRRKCCYKEAKYGSGRTFISKCFAFCDLSFFSPIHDAIRGVSVCDSDPEDGACDAEEDTEDEETKIEAHEFVPVAQRNHRSQEM